MSQQGKQVRAATATLQQAPDVAAGQTGTGSDCDTPTSTRCRSRANRYGQRLRHSNKHQMSQQGNQVRAATAALQQAPDVAAGQPGTGSDCGTPTSTRCRSRATRYGQRLRHSNKHQMSQQGNQVRAATAAL